MLLTNQGCFVKSQLFSYFFLSVFVFHNHKVDVIIGLCFFVGHESTNCSCLGWYFDVWCCTGSATTSSISTVSGTALETCTLHKHVWRSVNQWYWNNDQTNTTIDGSEYQSTTSQSLPTTTNKDIHTQALYYSLRELKFESQNVENQMNND